jgi:putative spermidine/putrescine transport system permease protein
VSVAGRIRRSSFAVIGAMWVTLIAIFLVLPLVVIIGASIGKDPFLKFPPTGFTLAWYDKMLGLSEFATPLWVSLRLGVAVAVLAAIGGALAAFAVARAPRLRRYGVEAIFLLPIVLPSLVVGLGLLVLFSLLGYANAWVMLILGHVSVTMPIVFQTSGVLTATLDRNLEFAAMTLGARPRTTFIRIVLPALRPALVSGMVMAFALSFDEFVISILLSTGGMTTFPVALFTYMRFSVSPTLAAISTVLIVATCLIAFALHRVVGLDVLFGLKRKNLR